MNIPYESFQYLRTLMLPSTSPLNVKALVVSSDGRTIISDTNDYEWGIIKVWDVQTGKVVHTLNTKHAVTCIAISLDGRTVVSGGHNELGAVVKVWDLHTGQATHTLVATPASDEERLLSSWMNSVAISPNKQVVVSGQMLSSEGKDWRTKNSGQIKVWNLQTEQEICTLTKASLLPMRAAINVELPTLFCGSGWRGIKVWDWQIRQEICTLQERRVFGLKGYFDFVRSVAISQDGHIVVTGSHHKTIKVWDWQTRKKICTLSGHSSAVRSVSISPDGQIITSCSEDGTVKVWGLP